MKNLLDFCLIIALVSIFSFGAEAQPMPPHRRPEGPRKEMQTPEQIAQAKTLRMQKEVDLNDKQFKKIYKIYLKEEQAKRESSEGFMAPPPGGFPGGGPGGFPGGRPPMGGGPGMGHGAPPPGMFGEMAVPTVGGKAIDSDEYIDGREKKFKKILSPEQYKRFRSIHPDPTGFFVN